MDVSVFYKQQPLTAISFKFVTSHYKQNANNYFEHIMGETANLQRGKISYATLFVLPSKIKYITRSGTANDAYEKLSSHHIEKYMKLYADNDCPHKLEAMGFVLVDIDYERNVDKLGFSQDVVTFLKKEVNLNRFF